MILASPNFDTRPAGIEIDTIVMHYTGKKTVEEWLIEVGNPEVKLSAHYLIDNAGEIFPLVTENNRAWHAGISHWRGRDNVNDFSIGIEIANPGHEFGYIEFNIEQMESTIRLCQDLIEKHPIEARNIVGHSDVAPTRKEDPGELFSWEMLAAENIGIWPDMPMDVEHKELLKPGNGGDAVKDLQKRLVEFGYKLEQDGEFGIETSYVVTAFQRRFTPTNIGNIWHEEADIALNQLCEQFK